MFRKESNTTKIKQQKNKLKRDNTLENQLEAQEHMRNIFTGAVAFELKNPDGSKP